jgi:hypothetical protein
MISLSWSSGFYGEKKVSVHSSDDPTLDFTSEEEIFGLSATKPCGSSAKTFGSEEQQRFDNFTVVRSRNVNDVHSVDIN